MTTFLFFLVTGVNLILALLARKHAENRKINLFLSLIVVSCLLCLAVFFIVKAYSLSVA